ncbi:PEP-CTERM protein-sorting domain-containing protein [Verrucomicrobium sp. GAS474]|uniref:hypothetical protein n=1 Tax=Verrucomicrobium sp. GAS474 TaxID=1882831 RepID=UPI00087C5639|nr:hypothetical protein [Verrucomicrobium sp. GAS474]SDT85740.1 PEP-CTERM protein-sorting domain-containing protein [Verrucomicrobium sp. GAS474]
MIPLSRHRLLASALLLLGGTLLVGASSAEAQVTNGTLETWATTPTGWTTATVPNGTVGVGTTATPIQIAGLTSGSTSAAYLPVGSAMSQDSSSSLTNFSLSFVVAATDPGNGNRSFNLALGPQDTNISQSGSLSATFINLKVIGTSTPGTLQLQTYNGSWQTIGTLQSSTFNTGTNTFTTLNAYDFTITGSFSNTYGASRYTISYLLEGSSTPTVISNISYFQGDPNGSALGLVEFNGSSSQSGYAIDNIVLAAVPEPGTNLLLGLGGLLFLTVLGRRSLERARSIAA